jgi:biotin transport system permease protein
MSALRRSLSNSDPRLKIAVALTSGLAVWHAGAYGTFLYLAVLLGIAGSLRLFTRDFRKTLRAYAGFVLLWVGVKIGVDLISGGAPASVLFEGLLLGVRLCTVLFIGLFLAELTSLRSMGAAVAWSLRPILGAHAWKGALALALTVHFLPLFRGIASTILSTMRLRGAHVPLLRRVPLFTGALLRSAGQKTWSRTLALAARRLDEPEAWAIRLQTSPWECLWAALLAALFTLPALL